MMENEFDDQLKQRLHQHEAYVPDDMWQRIVADKKKRRGGFVWVNYFTALLLLLSGLGVYIFYSGSGKNNSVKSPVVMKNKSQYADSVININANEQNGLTNNIRNSFNNLPDKKYPLLYANKGMIKNAGKQTPDINQNLNLPQCDSINIKISEQPETTTQDSAHKKNNETQTVNNTGNDKHSIDKEENYDKISLKLFASPDVPLSGINSSDHDYQQLLQKAINMRLSYTLGAGISVAVTKKISLSAGIQYSRVNEAISLSDSSQSKYDTLNHFTFINVPFMLNYKTTWTNSFHTSVNAGILFNISSNYKGGIPNTFGGLTDISHNIYKSNTGVSLYAGINLSKAITNTADIFAEPYFRYQIKNITDHLQPFGRRINTAGLALGIEYRLFKK